MRLLYVCLVVREASGEVTVPASGTKEVNSLVIFVLQSKPNDSSPQAD